jgi:hydrogenase nickel incorporation protein HypA/HybF
MHELGITQRIRDAALERAAAADARRITAVHLEIGEESDVAPDSVAFYWPEVTRGTKAEGARLVFADAADPRACRLVAIDVDD